MRQLFGTNGIRGIVNETIDCLFALNIGMAYGSFKKGKIAVGRDSRISGLMLKDSFISGLLSAGCEVIDTDIVPTPAIQYYIKDNPSVKGGGVITASHNPPEYNGIKVIAEDGTEASMDEERKIEEVYFEKKFNKANWRDTGAYSTLNIIDHYVEGVKNVLDLDSIKCKDLKIVLDAANGPGSLSSPIFLKDLGIRYVGINTNIDGTFPGRNPEPTEENLEMMQKFIKNGRFDLGVAHDGDADRSVFFDEKGRFIDGDIILSIVAKYILEERGEGTVVTTVATSSSLKDVVEECGGRVIETPVGSIYVARTMMETGAIFGGEGNGGLIFAEHQYCRDGLAALGKIIEIMVNENKSLSELVDEIPRYHIFKDKMAVKSIDDRKDIIEMIKKTYSSDERAQTENDGIKIYYGEKDWILIRESGTEPILRIYAEAKNEKRAKDLLDYGKKLIKNGIKNNYV